MVADPIARTSRRKEGRYFLHLSKNLAEDSVLPFKSKPSVPVRVPIEREEERLLIMPLGENRTKPMKRR